MRDSPREIEHEIEQLGGGTSTGDGRGTSSGHDCGGYGRVGNDTLQDAYADVFGDWKRCCASPSEYNHAREWLDGERDLDDLPPIPTGWIREELIEAIRRLADVKKFFEEFPDPGPEIAADVPGPEEREAMIEAVREVNP